ncbi:MAG: zinc ribbon domain-containing protein [Candidatus Planktophila sp.]|nr:zinc ribbon domain-containing protein [Candidatus Planktophila sp.]
MPHFLISIRPYRATSLDLASTPTRGLLLAIGATVPTYQYACNACSHEFEAVQSFSDDSLTKCPVCTGEIRKIYSAVGVVFKGSGFYKTDSVKKKTTSEVSSPAPVAPAPVAPAPKSD